MNKLLVAFGLIASFTLLPTVAGAAPPPQPTRPPLPSSYVRRGSAWNLLGSYVISFDCTHCVPHNFTITSYNHRTGVFSGSGVYAANPAYTWTVSGVVTGKNITMHILYTGADAGYYVNLTGVIARNGTMSGTATDASGAQFGWSTTSGHATHGFFEDDQDD